MKPRKQFSYEYAMTIRTQKKADSWFKRLVDSLQKKLRTNTREEIERIQRSNLAYFAGYYDGATRERVERLFKCEHPVFGKIRDKGQPSLDQAFQLGRELGERERQQMIGAGKYEKETKDIMQEQSADVVMVIVAGGKKGSGFSVAMRPSRALMAATIIALRLVADELQKDLDALDAQPRQ